MFSFTFDILEASEYSKVIDKLLADLAPTLNKEDDISTCKKACATESAAIEAADQPPAELLAIGCVPSETDAASQSQQSVPTSVDDCISVIGSARASP